MKPKLINLLVLSIFAYSCTPSKVNKKLTDTGETKSAMINLASKKINNDTLFVDAKCVVRLNLDTIQLDKLRKKYGDEGFYTGADDNVYYSSVVDSVITAKQLLRVVNKQEKFVKFVNNGKAVKVVKIDTLSQPSNFYFFEPGKSVYAPDITMIEDEYKNYFKN
ncbi:MAG: hypothetical protein JKY70_06025 [Mucilaginibacter sp.]|nr:hypothetical protein [Mucilaginibacter sp.]